MRLLRRAREWFRPATPVHLARRFRGADASGLERVRTALVERWFEPAYLTTAAGQADLENHLTRRLEHDRRQVIPWLDAAWPLDGALVIEIGCGTGSSTVALAEQGALVTAVDIDAAGLAVARARLAAYGVSAELVELDATKIAEHFAGRSFDAVIFYASLEHMTHNERLEALRQAWNLLHDGQECPSHQGAPPHQHGSRGGGLLVVVEAPNRLWYFDHHTSHLNFFQWLPDDLALAYAGHSPRPGFGESHAPRDSDSMLRLLRAGRGVSYHEFELALGPLEKLQIEPSLAEFQRQRDLALRLRWLTTFERRYERMLARIEPRVPPAFLASQLNVIIRKP